jgi:cytochrome c oxidase subunit II
VAIFGADTRSLYLHVARLYLPIGIAVFAIVTVTLLAFLVRYRARPGETREPKRKHEANVLESAYILVLAAIAVLLIVRTFTTEDKVDTVSATTPLRVKVVGSQWQWRFQFEGTQVVQGTVNGRARLTVPAGRVIRFDGTSLDVIHDFWIPKMKYQHQVFPEHTSSWDLTFPKPGTYPGLCAWFCGLYHQNMHFDVIAVPPKQFAAWLSKQKENA